MLPGCYSCSFFFNSWTAPFSAQCLSLTVLFSSCCWTKMYKEFCGAPHRHHSDSVPLPHLLLSHWLQRTLFRILMSLLNWSADGDISPPVSHGAQTQIEGRTTIVAKSRHSKIKKKFYFLCYTKSIFLLFMLPTLLTFVSDWKSHRLHYSDTSSHGFISCYQSVFPTFLVKN